MSIIDEPEHSAGQVFAHTAQDYVNAYLLPDKKAWVETAIAGACPTDSMAELIGVRITRLSLAEAAHDGRVMSGAYADLEFCSWDEYEWRIRFRAEGVAQERTDARDEDRHARLLVGALRDAVDAYAAARAAGPLLDELLWDSVQVVNQRELPILKKPRLPVGVFWSADHFRQAIITPMSDSIIERTSSGRIRLRGDLRNRADGIYAVSDGRRYHLRWEGRFLPLMWEGTKYTAVITDWRFEPDFGMHMSPVTVRMERIPLQLDLVSGKLIRANNYESEALVKHTIHLPGTAPAGTSVHVLAGRDTVLLEPGTHTRLTYATHIGKELVRIRHGDQELAVAMETATKGEAVHVIELSAVGTPSFTALTGARKKELLARLQPTDQRPLAAP